MMNMKFKFHLPSALRPACFKEPATRDTGNTQHNPIPQVSPSPELQPANAPPRRHSPSKLQKWYAKEKKSRASAPFSSEPVFGSPHLQQRFIEIEQQVTGFMKYLTEYFTEHDGDALTTSMFDKMMEDCLKHGIRELDQEVSPFLADTTDKKFRKELQNSISLAKERLQAAVEETKLSEGWKTFQPKESKLTWEFSDGPLLIKRGLSLQQVKLDKADIASGAYGSVSIFKNENGDKLIGKILKKERRNADGSVRDDLAKELEAYQTIYRKGGPHRNLVNVYGIAQVPKNDREVKHGPLDGCGLLQLRKNSEIETERVLLMDFIPGLTGEKAFDALHKRWDTGKISSQQYWGAMQFIGRRLLDVTEHLGKAEVVHNDIKPANFMVNEETGEPVVIDLGLWTKPGVPHSAGTRRFMAPEVKVRQGSAERSDVFTVGASLLYGIEGGRLRKMKEDLHKLRGNLNELESVNVRRYSAIPYSA